MKNFVNDIGLNITGTAHNNLVEQAATLTFPPLNTSDIEALYTYSVPAPSDNGACALKAKEPYDLRQTLKLTELELSQHAQTIRLLKLKEVIIQLQVLTGVDWLGIYRRTENLSGEAVLLKEAYYGRFSRAEFPLTPAFAKHSNNSTVGLSGKAVVAQSVQNYDGPYYTCDKTVQSEFCVPILNPAGQLIGIIDAEAFTPDFFTDQKLLEIIKVAFDLGRSELLDF